MPETFLDRIDLHCGDCLAVLATLPDNSIDSCVTDPPYHLTSIVKRFGSDDAAPPKEYTSAPYGGNFPYRDSGGGTGAAFARMSKGFMGKVWDGGDIAFRPEVWMQIFRVLKPGGYVLAFGGTRTYHRMACAIEDAGFDVRDMISWIYGSGFPKSHDVSKGIDRAAGAERISLGRANGAGSSNTESLGVFQPKYEATAPATDAAREWEGWGTALKPALEPICMARKPLSEGTVAANVLEHGTGAINVDGCRVVSWEQEDATYCSCAERADVFRKTGVPGTKESSAIKRVEPILNGDQKTIPVDIVTTDIGCCDGLKTENIGTSSSTDEYGKTLTGRSQTDTKSTTSMDEKQTTASRICSVCGGMITPNNTDSTTHERTISQPDELQPSNHATSDGSILNGLKKNEREAARNTIASKGRWPSNLIHDGSEEVVAAFPDSDGQQGAVTGSEPSAKTATVWGSMHRVPGDSREPRNDSGSAARFFYSAKADADDRIGSKHPTVKPVDLMQYLVRLITPPHGTVIDPFAGTGTTGEAAWREGMHAVLIEAEPEYQNDIRRRMKLCMAGPDERLRESIKAKNLPYDPGPLFGSPGLKGEGRQIYGKYADQNPRTDAWDEMWAKPFDFSAEPKGNPG